MAEIDDIRLLRDFAERGTSSSTSCISSISWFRFQISAFLISAFLRSRSPVVRGPVVSPPSPSPSAYSAVSKRVRWFVLSAGVILLAAALNRFLIATGSARSLSMPESVLGIPLRYGVLLVGALELVVGLVCLFGKRLGLKLGWLIWLSFDLMVYRAALFYLHCNPQTSCLGGPTDRLHLSRSVLAPILPILPFYLLIGSGAAALWLWSIGRESRYLKMSCPSCGVHIKFLVKRLGEKTVCPQCRATITLRRPENLKMSCFFCHGHIEFPAHAIGNKLQCPHCKKDITLKEPATA
jgi:hypothetical protein